MSDLYTRNVPIADFVFKLVDSTSRPDGLTGASPTVTITKDGAAFVAASGSVTETASGEYKLTLSGTELNAETSVGILAIAAGADDSRTVLYERNSIEKGVALTNYIFVMVDSTARPDGKTGLSPTVTLAGDGAAFGASTNSASEISSGFYKIDLTQAERSFDTLAIHSTGAGADAWDDIQYLNDIASPVLTSNFSLGRLDIIKHSLLMVGDKRTYTTEAAQMLDIVIKSLQTRNVFLYKAEDIVAAFTQSSEIVGTDTLNYTCYRPVESAADNRPITGAKWRSYYFQSGSDGVAWTSGQNHTASGVISLDTDTLNIEKATLRQSSYDQQIRIINGYTYRSIALKHRTGRPIWLWFEQTANPKIWIYPQVTRDDVDNNVYTLNYTRVKRLGNYSTSDDTFDFDVRWQKPLIHLLAAALAWQYDLTGQRVSMLEQKAERLLKDAMTMNLETGEQLSDPDYGGNQFGIGHNNEGGPIY